MRRTEATVIPVYFDGQNSRLFQIASHLSQTIRLALIFRETARRMKTPMDLVIGEPITPKQYGHYRDRDELLRFLRRGTYMFALVTKRRICFVALSLCLCVSFSQNRYSLLGDTA